MGLIINDAIALDIGITVSNSYASFGCSTVRSYRIGDNYESRGILKYWVDEESRCSEVKPLKQQTITAQHTKPNFKNIKIYKELYINAKNLYNDVQDTGEE